MAWFPQANGECKNMVAVHQSQQNMGGRIHPQDCSNGDAKETNPIPNGHGCACEPAEHGSAVGADRVEPAPRVTQGPAEHDAAVVAGREGSSLSVGDLGQEEAMRVAGAEEEVGVEITGLAGIVLENGCSGELTGCSRVGRQ